MLPLNGMGATIVAPGPQRAGEKRRSLAALVLAACVAGASGAALAGEPRCPVDDGALSLPAPSPWNTAGGVDSDGCTYGIDAQGRRWVVGLDQVVHCPRCQAALRRDHLGASLTADEVQAVRAAVGRVPPPPPEEETVGAAQRHRLAAAVYRALGAARFGLELDTDALVGALLLRAAWAVRGEAVARGADAEFRPRDVAEARAFLEWIERRLNRTLGDAPEVRRLDEQLASLEESRLQLNARLRTGSASDRLIVLRAEGALAAVERAVLETKADRLQAIQGRVGWLDEEELELALLRARIRFGGPALWRPAATALAALEGRRGREARRILALCASEADLLERAQGAFTRAAARASEPDARAALLYLAGDCARRRGAPWRDQLRQVVALAPSSSSGLRAAALLDG